MSEELFIPVDATKKEKYETLLPQLAALIAGEKDLIANLANISAALKETFNWLWVGFYWVKNGELVLGPFQGTIACTRIQFGKGVCGTVWKNTVETLHARSLLVSDVNAFVGHIACSSSSVAEIVLPIFDKQGQVAGVLDVDSERYDVFDATDGIYLEKISKLITETM
jgi:GAF domain-containing protein